MTLLHRPASSCLKAPNLLCGTLRCCLVLSVLSSTLHAVYYFRQTSNEKEVGGMYSRQRGVGCAGQGWAGGRPRVAKNPKKKGVLIAAREREGSVIKSSGC